MSYTDQFGFLVTEREERPFCPETGFRRPTAELAQAAWTDFHTKGAKQTKEAR